jgi:hypothetical protein
MKTVLAAFFPLSLTREKNSSERSSVSTQSPKCEENTLIVEESTQEKEPGPTNILEEQRERSEDLAEDDVTVVDVLAESGTLSESQWTELLAFRTARELFLQELDDKRGRRAELNKESFQAMSLAMKVKKQPYLFIFDGF